jgi:molybdenum cofactor synthesis domain-containing protein
MAGQPSAAVLTIGNELVSGDVENTNGSWLATRLERLGVAVHLIAAVPDEVDRIASFVRTNAPTFDVLIVTGGLGGTPDDVTREAVAAAFEVPQTEVPDVAAGLRARFRSDPDYVSRWALLPRGARPLENPLGGAPGFTLANVYVLPGLPAEMQAMFATIETELHGDSPIASWRRRYRTTESRIVGVLEAMGELHPGVLVGSYPRFDSLGSEVEIVVKSRDPAALASAAEWIEAALDEAMR